MLSPTLTAGASFGAVNCNCVLRSLIRIHSTWPTSSINPVNTHLLLVRETERAKKIDKGIDQEGDGSKGEARQLVCASGQAHNYQIVRARLALKFTVCLALLVITFALFGQTLGHDFINLDDPEYVAQNPHIQSGVNWRSIVWAFTHIHSNNWHPLTSISHMLDCQLFGLNPGAHHLVNVFFHGVTAALLFVFLEQVTGSLWRSAFVAAIFAIHPLRVESVAWISERKDVLSGLFFMLTLLAYVHYTRRPNAWRYCAMSILFVSGLLSKPMLVMLPFLLLLLDYRPLNRPGDLSKLLLEKIPLFVLSAGSAVATLIAQSAGDIGLVRLEVLPFSWRITNALASYLIYIWQMIWPADLALAYGHPGKLPLWQVAGSFFLLIAISAGAFALRKKAPYLIVGWVWYLVLLVPVIGFVQVGGQSHADRYTYLPQIGLYLAITWGVVDLCQTWRCPRFVLGLTAGLVISVFSVCAAHQVSFWHDSEKLWRHALAVTKNNDLAHLNLGLVLADQKHLDEAITELQSVVARHPNDADARLKLANALFVKEGRMNDAIRQYEAAAALGPNPELEIELANLLLAQGRTEEAVGYYRHVVQMQPTSALAHYNLAVGLHRLGQLSEAIVHYREALRIDPNYPDANRFLEQAVLEKEQSEARFRLKP